MALCLFYSIYSSYYIPVVNVEFLNKEYSILYTTPCVGSALYDACTYVVALYVCVRLVLDPVRCVCCTTDTRIEFILQATY